LGPARYEISGVQGCPLQIILLESTSLPLNEPETYDVHLFPIIRLKISGITASSPAEAIEMAQSQFPTEQFETALCRIGAEDAEEFSHYLVDVAGDEDFERSRFFHSTSEPCLEPLRRLVDWVDAGRDRLALVPLILEVREILKATV